MKAKIAALFALTALGSAPYAHATVGTVSYFGIVAATQTVLGETEPAPTYDVANLFGGGNLEGDFVTATFTYNTYNGYETYAPGVSDDLQGGASFGSNAFTSAVFTVELPGSTVSYSYDFVPDVYNDANTSATGIQDIAYGALGDALYAYITPGEKVAYPTTLSQSYSGLGYGPGSYFLSGSVDGVQDTIPFDTLSVTVSAAPEPSTWALSILGVALAGGALRVGRHRRQVAA